MDEERRLLSIGFPLEDAISICFSMRREGTLSDFVYQQEEIYHDRLESQRKEQ